MQLTRENIMEASVQAKDFLDRNGVDSKTQLRYSLFLEELLIEYLSENESKEFELVFKSNIRSISIKLYVDGKSLDLIKSKTKIIERLLGNLPDKPAWGYKKQRNVITYSTKPIGPDYSNVGKVLKYMAKNKKSFVVGTVLRFVQMLFNILEPLISAQIIVAYSGKEINKIFLFALLLLAQAAGNSAINYFASRLLRVSYGKLMKELKYDLTENILEIKTECMDEKGSGVFTQRLINETTNVADHIDDVLEASTDLFRLVSLAVAFAVISVKMLAFEAVLLVVYVLIQKAHTRNLTDDSRRARTAMEKHTSFAGEMVRAHRDIKLMHCEESFITKIKDSIDESVDLVTDMRVRSMKFILLRSQFVGWTNFLYMTLLALQMSVGSMTPATALVLFNYNGRVYSCASSLTSIITSLHDLALSSERIYQLMNSSDYEKEVFGQKHIDTVRGDIELKNVSFAYKRANGSKVPVLDGINLHIKAGEFVALVGQSGCGKSTILSLLSRLYDPDSGEVTLDGCNVRELDVDTLRGNIEMVSQMPYIFNMSVRENLSVVRNDLTDEEMINACKIACIHDDIMKLPQGYDTIVGEGGISLSGGQRQRLALARSMVRDYPIILLDEATSALDNITQSKIRSAIDNMQGQRTIIMVAHRLSTVINCEHLFFIADGKVLAEGTHQELLDKCKEYRALYREESSVS